jgi:hypothetical protein
MEVPIRDDPAKGRVLPGLRIPLCHHIHMAIEHHRGSSLSASNQTDDVAQIIYASFVIA